MAVAHVTEDWDGSTGSTTAHVYNSGLTITAGHTIAIAVFASDGGSGAGNKTATVTDSHSNTYTFVDTADGGVANVTRMRTYYAKNVAGGANYTVTVTWSGAVSGYALTFHVLSGADATTPLVGNAISAQNAPGTGTDAISSTAITPSAANSYLFGAMFSGTAAGTITAGTGYTLRIDNATFGLSGVNTENLIQGSAASKAATFTDSVGPAGVTTALMAFQPTVTTSGKVTHNTRPVNLGYQIGFPLGYGR